jgi:hypothetical protein
MMHVFFALLSACTAAGAQDEEVYKTLSVGDRIQITFRNGNTITGNLVALPAPDSQPDPRRVKPAAAPFHLLFFAAKDDPVGQAQETALERWMARHPEGKVETPGRESHAEVWKAHGIGSAPALVFIDKAGGRSLKLTGFQAETQLTEALIRFRATSPVEMAVDYSREKALTIDLSWEYPGLNGTISVPKDQVKAIRKLRALDPKIIKQLEEEKKKLAQQLKRENEERLTLEEDRDREAQEAARKREEEGKAGAGNDGDRIIKEGEKLKKALEVYQRFPPPEWGPEKLQEIQARSIRKQPIPLNEREFMVKYDEWLAARDYYEKKKGEKKDVEEKKPAAPAPANPTEKKSPPPTTEEKPPEEKNP